MTDPGTHLFWITSRAAGISALVLASAAVAAGLAIGTKRVRGTRVRTLHETLSLATLAALALHGLALLGDGWLHPGLAGIVVPFAGSYRPLWTGLGVIGGYGLAALSLSYYARGRIGVARWRVLHRFVALFWLLGAGHALGSGTDAAEPWFLVLTGAVVLPPLAMLAVRWSVRLRSGDPDRPAPRAPASEPARTHVGLW